MGASGGSIDEVFGGAQGNHITVSAEAHDAPNGNIGDGRMVAERLPLIDVREVHFDAGDADRQNDVADGDAGVGIGGRVDNQDRDLTASRLNTINQEAFAIGLEGLKFESEFGSEIVEIAIDIGEGRAAVNFRFTLAQQIEIRPVDHENLGKSGAWERFAGRCHRSSGAAYASALNPTV